MEGVAALPPYLRSSEFLNPVLNRSSFIRLGSLLLFFCLSFPAGTVSASGLAGTLTIKSAGPFTALTHQWAEAFMKKNPRTAIQVTETGSADITVVNWPVEDSVSEKNIPVAVEAVGVYVNQDSPVVEITFDQLRAVYSGQVTDWSATGSTLGPITVYGVEKNSDAGAMFQERVLQNKPFSSRVIILPNTEAVAQAVNQDVRAIGFGGTISVKGVKVLPVGKGDQTNTYYPDARGLALGLYPLSRQIFFRMSGDPSGLAKSFIDWVHGPVAGKICLHLGYFPYVKQQEPATDDTLDQETMGRRAKLW